ncbi:LysR family transcriptional regulator [Frankia sp. Cas3]|uniref:LysR family transcriptional regulator n=1 Tax=Frankia sp. Cas3 TaxID=3073926 RepID=UPI002AD5744A|nr:LysR family transcriptional regulator [Frankia sp. Cas3]
MELPNVDLNLLRTLDVLLQEASVTRASQRLQVSQPAVSLALAKLRRHFGDDLLRRAGNHYELTPLAVQLKERTSLAMLGARRVFEAAPAFDPTAERREFTLLCSDYAAAVLSEALQDLSFTRAPGVVLRFERHTTADIDHAVERIRTVDGIVLPHGFLSNLPYTELYTDDWVCLIATANTRVGDSLTMELLAELSWVFTYHGPTAFTPAGRQLQLLGVEPRVQVVIDSFLALPFAIAGTDRVGLVQRRLARKLTAAGDVRALECPFDAVAIAEALWWHPMYERDPAHIWLRALLTDAGSRLMTSGPATRST